MTTLPGTWYLAGAALAIFLPAYRRARLWWSRHGIFQWSVRDSVISNLSFILK